MAKDTSNNLKNKIIYQVFPRQHSNTSNFNGVTNDLDRIKALGVDILYLLPIHPIGVKNKKGSLGCPYSVQNYRLVNPNLGTLEDFINLINETHKRNMKIIIDIVFNHTSKDSYILNNHPEWMYKNDKGEFSNKNGDWWDVTDLDFNQKELWDELIDTLCYWAKLGVDGFRCDVASLIPLEFWITARTKLHEINSEIILFAETTDYKFIKYYRDIGFISHSDNEMYEAFDIEYDYDIWELYRDYLFNRKGLNYWLKALENQDAIYPKNYIKAHALENHDQPRAASYIKDEVRLRNLNALIFFLKGNTFIYAGQEACEEKQMSLFEFDLNDWSTLGKYDMVSLFQKCAELKKDKIIENGIFNIHLEEIEVAHITYQFNQEKIEILLNLGNISDEVNSKLPDGKYINLFNNEEINIIDNKLKTTKDPIIIKM